MELQGQDVIVAVALALAIRGHGAPAEVEKRLDFAERLLAQAREADQLPGGMHR